MKPGFDIQFFGGGGSKTRQVRKRDPNPVLDDFQTKLGNMFQNTISTLEPFRDINRAKRWSDAVQGRQWDLMNNQQALINAQRPMIDQVSGMIRQIPGQVDSNKALLNEMLGVVRSGNIPRGVMDRMNAAVNSGLEMSMGSMLNDLAGRGVVNSTITSKGVSDLSQAAADAFNRNYLNAYNSVLGGYGQGLQHSQSALGNMLSAVGAANNTLGALNSGISGLSQAIGTYGQLPGQYYQTALAPLMPAYNFWKDMGQMHYGHEDYDTIVKQGK